MSSGGLFFVFDILEIFTPMSHLSRDYRKLNIYPEAYFLHSLHFEQVNIVDFIDFHCPIYKNYLIFSQYTHQVAISLFLLLILFIYKKSKL